MSDPRVFQVHGVQIGCFGCPGGFEIILFNGEEIFVQSVVVTEADNGLRHGQPLRKKPERHVSCAAGEDSKSADKLSVIRVERGSIITSKIKSEKVDRGSHKLKAPFFIYGFP